jgi:hypothetical protein
MMSGMYYYAKSYWTADPEVTANGVAAAAPEAPSPGEANGFANGNTTNQSEEGSGADSPNMISSGAATPLTSHVDAKKQYAVYNATQPDELTSLLDKQKTQSQQEESQHDLSINLYPTRQHPPTALEYYFTPNNPTVQRYYRFSATPITPIVALHKKPGTGNAAIITSGVTGLLRRSAVVPSHGTDSSGDWILVSVGGRSGWARKKLPEQHFSGFTLADTFQGTEGWMGNHAFLCGGKVMLGSDAPSLFFTNILLVAGFFLHFFVLLPRLRLMEQEENEGSPQNNYLFLSTNTIFWSSLVCALSSWITLWVSAIMDPGILPPVSSPIKAPVPSEDIPLGGPLGYRYCSTCNIFRPPRSKHCNSCNVCVSKFDQYVLYYHVRYGARVCVCVCVCVL